LRITGGLYCGRRIKCPPGVIRPAMDRMRESMFSILDNQYKLEGLSFLDLFSGSGIVGVEAASRGAFPVTLVEMDKKKFKVLKENTGFLERPVQIKLLPVERFIRSCRESYDMIYIDPPFNYKKKEKLLLDISEREILKDKGLALIHLPKEENLPENPGRLKQIDKRRYGRSVLLFYQFNQMS
jgi:16S rRNA (guanine966-N2)-methyltransferase